MNYKYIIIKVIKELVLIKRKSYLTMDQTDLDREYEIERDSINLCLEMASYNIQQIIHELELRLERIKSYLSKYERELLEKKEKEEKIKQLIMDDIKKNIYPFFLEHCINYQKVIEEVIYSYDHSCYKIFMHKNRIRQSIKRKLSSPKGFRSTWAK